MIKFLPHLLDVVTPPILPHIVDLLLEQFREFFINIGEGIKNFFIWLF